MRHMGRHSAHNCVAAIIAATASWSVINGGAASCQESRKPARRDCIALPIPGPISAEDCGLFARLLNLEDMASISGSALFQEYLKKDQALRRAKEEPLWELSADLLPQHSAGPSVASAKAVNDLLREADALVQEIDSLDRWFIDELAVRIENIDPINLERVRLLRKRIVLSSDHCQFPVPEIDLTTLELQLGLDVTDGSPEAEALREEILEYEQSRTNLLERHRRLGLEAKTKCALLSAETFERERALSAPVDEQQRADLWKGYLSEAERLNGRSFGICLRLKELNDRHVESLRMLGAPATTETLVRKYRELAFPAVYPDDASLESILLALNTSEVLSPTVLEDLRVLTAEYSTAHEELSNQMIDMYIESRKQLCLTWTTGESTIQAQQRYAAVWEKRIALSEDAVLALRNMLTAPQLDEVSGELDAWQDVVVRLRASGPRGLLRF